MKLTKKILEDIIREELNNVISEQNVDTNLKLKLGSEVEVDPVTAAKKGAVNTALMGLAKKPLTKKLAREASSLIKDKNLNIGNLVRITQGLLALDKDPELLKNKNFMEKHNLFLKIGNFKRQGADLATQKAAILSKQRIARRPGFWGLAIGARW